jgi:hypothetical protein
MSASGTLLISALLERMSAAESKALLQKLDKSIEQSIDRHRPAQAAAGRRRADSRTHNTSEDTTHHTTKDSVS